jgi:transposase
VQLIRQQIQIRNQIECLLEEGRIKLSSVVSDLLGVSGRRILDAMVEGKSTPAGLAALADSRLRATPQELQEACEGALLPSHRFLLKMFLEQIDQLEQHVQEIERELGEAQQEYKAALARLCKVPGIDLQAARQIAAEIGPEVAAFASAQQLASWAGVCPGRQESAGVSVSNGSPKGNPHLRRILNQVAWAAIRTEGSSFQNRFQRWAPRLGAQKAAWAIAHKLLKLIWKMLRHQVEYKEQGSLLLDAAAVKRQRRRLTTALNKLGFAVTLTAIESNSASPA